MILIQIHRAILDPSLSWIQAQSHFGFIYLEPSWIHIFRAILDPSLEPSWIQAQSYFWIHTFRAILDPRLEPSWIHIFLELSWIQVYILNTLKVTVLHWIKILK